MKEKRYEEAIEDFDRALEIDPEYALAFSNRGYVKYKLTLLDDALEDVKKAIALDPDDVYFYENLAEIHIAMDVMDNAKKSIEKIKELDPDFHGLFHIDGLIHHKEGNLNDACQAWKKAVELGSREAQEKLDEFCKDS